MLDKFLSSVFDEEHEFNDIWELKLIKFDADLDDSLKPYEKHLAVSNTVEDIKGNPGIKGNFFLTNLRLIWYSSSDKDVNLSIGLDTINNVFIKSTPGSGFNEVKHILTVKSASPNQTKYQFKFAGNRESQQKIFKKVEDMFKKCIATKHLRNIDTNIQLHNGQFEPLDYEQFKTKYEQCTFYQNQHQKEVKVIITNIRIIILHKKGTGVNYGIPWIMIESLTKTDKDNRDALEIKIKGLLKGVQIYLTCAHRSDFSKMHKEIVSFSETYNKNPMLGTNISLSNQSIDKARQIIMRSPEIQQIEMTKVNIGRRKNAYGDNNKKGSIQQTYFNDQLGIMMEKLPQGFTRKDLWQILRD